MRVLDVPAYVRDTALRMLPHRSPTGLQRIGNPGPDSPVLVTGNFALTVRRLRDTLQGRDAWLLVANSKGVNVWCAAGGGHLTHHDVIAAIRTSRLEERVSKRDVILPQLCATGVEAHRITEATGFETRWGPARMEDLPAFLDRGGHVRKRDRFMRFPAWERAEMATMWSAPMLVIAIPILLLVSGLTVAAVGGATVTVMVFALFALLPLLPVQGNARYLTFGAFAGLGMLLGAGILFLLNAATPAHLVVVAVSCVSSALVLSTDVAGTTPWYASSINTHHNAVHVELVEPRCTGAAECVLVCPRDVLAMDGRRRKVTLRRPEQCIQCGACIVQCPSDALRFRHDDGRVVEAAAVRSTRLNLLGSRGVKVPD